MPDGDGDGEDNVHGVLGLQPDARLDEELWVEVWLVNMLDDSAGVDNDATVNDDSDVGDGLMDVGSVDTTAIKDSDVSNSLK